MFHKCQKFVNHWCKINILLDFSLICLIFQILFSNQSILSQWVCASPLVLCSFIYFYLSHSFLTIFYTVQSGICVCVCARVWVLIWHNFIYYGCIINFSIEKEKLIVLWWLILKIILLALSINFQTLFLGHLHLPFKESSEMKYIWSLKAFSWDLISLDLKGLQGKYKHSQYHR